MLVFVGYWMRPGLSDRMHTRVSGFSFWLAVCLRTDWELVEQN